MKKIAILAITKNGINIGKKIKNVYKNWNLYVPKKFSNKNDDDPNIMWFDEPSTKKIEELFKTNDALICLFSLGAVIRLIAPHLKDKKIDPAVIVIDDKANFVISVLSGHLGGANQLAEDIADKLKSKAVITTAADVNKTIAVDLVGSKFEWVIEDSSTVTATSAHMVNAEKIAIFQNAGEKKWWDKEFPKNITLFDDYEEMKKSNSKAYLIISDQKIGRDDPILQKSVIYRPKSLVFGIGLHWDTSKETIKQGINEICEKFQLSSKSISRLVSIKKPKDVQGLIDVGIEMGVPIEYVNREDLASINTPNPSDTVKAFEGTASVSEAAAILVSKGQLIVEKQKFPPNLTIAVARIKN